MKRLKRSSSTEPGIGMGNLAQTYTSYLYTTKEAIFEGHGAPEPNPTFAC
jgi:hypothetical protein